MPYLRTWLVVCALAVGTACGADKSSRADTGSANASPGGGAGGTTSTDSSTGIGTGETAAWFAIEGTLELASGELTDDNDATLNVRFFEQDAPSLDLPLCEAVYTITGVAAPAPDPDVDMFGWWNISLADPTDCTAQPLQTTLALGIGAYDPLLDPAVGRLGIDPATLNGLYAQLTPGGPLYVFGLAGTTEQYEGSTDAVSESPPADGQYVFL
ncbi:MAG: hypothetical protein ACI8PZ_002182, partial [Myxococcota bacterium]